MKAAPKKTETVKPFDLQESIHDAIKDMIKEREENPSFFSPAFLDLYDRPHMLELIKSVYDFARELIVLEDRVEALKTDGKRHEADAILQLETPKVEQLGRLMAQRYSQLLINLRNYHITDNDRAFFETLIFFIVKVLQPAFEKKQLIMIEEEVGRLFRSTAFNIPRRRNVQEEKLRKFPQLKGQAKKDPDQIIQTILERKRIPQHVLRTRSRNQAVRLGYVRMSPFKAMSARSPLLSLILPSPHDKIRNFEEARRRKVKQQRNKLPGLVHMHYQHQFSLI